MSVNLIIHIKWRLYARFGDLRLKTGGVPPFEKSKKNRRKSPIFGKRLAEIEILHRELDSLGSITYV